MDNFVEGDVIICSTGQAGTIIQTGPEFWVLLRNYDVWVGMAHQIRFPQDLADLEACPLDVERLEKTLIRVDKQRD